MLKWRRKPRSIRCSRIARTGQFRRWAAVMRCLSWSDDSIEAQPEIYMEAGDHETLVHISHAQFARLTANARHGRFSEKLPNSVTRSIVWG